MLYYNEYINGFRYIREYDEQKHGTPRFIDSRSVTLQIKIEPAKLNLIVMLHGAEIFYKKYI